MTSPILWKARQAVCYLDKADNLTTIATTASLDTFFANSKSTITGWIKDLSVTGSKGDVELVNAFGENATGFQNQLLEKKPFEIVELTGTLIFSAVNTCSPIASYLFGDPVLVDTAQLQACDSAAGWVESANGAFDASDEVTITKEGSVSMKMVAQATTGEDETISDTITGTDLSAYDYVGFWYKSNVTTADAFIFGFGETAITDNEDTITPAVADQWVYHIYDISAITAADIDSVDNLGFTWNIAGAGTVYVDDISAFNNLRYRPGISNTTGGFTGRVDVAFLFRLTDGTSELNVLLDNATFATAGDIKMTSDGHAEVSISIKCLVKDYYEEYGNA